MAYTKITSEDTSGKGVIGIPDTPALTTTAMQEKFDEIALDVLVPKHNALIDELESTESGKGADAIGFDTGTSGITAETAGAALRELKGELDDKATTADVLTKDNAAEFTPTGQYNPATKKYVDDTVVAIGAGDMAKAVYDTDDNGKVDDADKLGGELPSAYEKTRLQFTDTSVPTTAFVADATYEDFPYRASVPLSGVLASMTPEVIFDVADAMSGNLAPVSECYAGGVYIYAAEVPEAATTIPTIICWKAVS